MLPFARQARAQLAMPELYCVLVMCIMLSGFKWLLLLKLSQTQEFESNRCNLRVRCVGVLSGITLFLCLVSHISGHVTRVFWSRFFVRVPINEIDI